MKRLLLWSLVLCTTGVFAQNFQGKAYYQSKTTVDMDSWGRQGREMSAEQKKRVQEMMKSYLEKVYVLDFTQTASTYKEEDKIEAPGRGGGFGRMMMGSFSPGKQYKDVKKGMIMESKEFFGKKFLIKDTLQKLEWKMEGETKQIGKYLCFKATALKKVDELDFNAMRPKKQKDDKDKTPEERKKDSIKAADDPFSQVDIPKEILVTAWYTLDIPISQGPGEFWGLPGLILEVNAYRTTVLCSKIVMNPGEKEIIEEPTKGEEVTRKEYNEIVMNKMKEMREMYRGRGRGGRGRGRG
ncbi:GLPGLI family protein [uncultured Kordia sp.]|uniref:GLPGLI family protein n=1 Tax=uncultured Kordia sp. TaxID=507699 RepID=UPI002616C449|nr:GLPGLI family protein [uncultured Kordia sp.]